jgi:4-amino-4-deoxy-L-arabinose transferase-like glycosyltransferase
MSELAEKPITTAVRTDWLCAVAILAFAALMRLAFFRGALGTDEIVYMTRARHLLAGDQVHASYIGGLRYGINAFEAVSLRLFGSGMAGADGLFFICSLAEVLLAYCFAHYLWGRRTAIWAALALATLPIDVSLAGSLNPDCYLALVIASSVVIFYFAQKEDRPALYFAAGLLAGWVFWIKESVIVYIGVFVLLALSERRWRTGWWWFTLAAFLCLIAHLALFWVLYGDALYVFETVHRTVDRTYVALEIADTSLWTYLILLFVKVYHTGLAGWLALAGCTLAVRRRSEPGTRFVVVWGVGLLLIFSAFPISFSPLKFVAKQSNYMEIFVLPLALIAGWFLAKQQRGLAVLLGGAMVLSGVVLSALEQQVVRVVTVNGSSAAAFAQAHVATPVFGPLTAQRQSAVERLLHGSLDGNGDIRPVAELPRVSLDGGAGDDVIAYIIEDPQMRHWPDATADGPLPRGLRACLTTVGQLQQGDLGRGRSVVAALRSTLSLLPTPYAVAALKATDPVWEVEPAKLYAVTRDCAREARDQS